MSLVSFSHLLFSAVVAFGLVLGPNVAPAQDSRSSLEAPFAQGQRALSIQGEQYGVLPVTHPLAHRVDRIFTKLLRVSGKRPGVVFEVYVLDTPKILVQAMPGGAVAISRGAVDETRGDDNALAFLLAHEIAHVIRDHHGLLSSYQQISVTGPSHSVASRKEEEARTLQAMELEADRLGLLYASLAGYRGRSAIPILQRVVALTGSSPFHPDPSQRAEAIQASMRQITAHLELFSLGLIYMATGQYEEASKIFETFASLYPSREVYNNLGVTYHKWALLYKGDDGWFRSAMVDSQTRARATLRDIAKVPPPTQPQDVHPLFGKYMDRALSAYRLAVESDPDYAIGHNNLGLVYLEAGEYDFAIGEFKRALRVDPKLPAAWNNRGIAYLKNGDAEQAKADFLQATALDPTYPAPHGNLARLYGQTGKADLAASARREFDRLKIVRSPRRSPTPGESISGVRVGMEVPKTFNEVSGTLFFSIPLGLRDEDSLRILVREQIGVVIATRQGKTEVIGATEGYRGRSALGITIGASAKQLRNVYRPPAWREEGQAGQLWVYPDHGVIFVLIGDRVASWWLSTRTDARTP